MKPIDKNEIYELVSKSIGLPKKDVVNIVEYYYKRIRKEISEPEYPNVNIRGLGRFTVSKKKLEEVVKNKKSFLKIINENRSIISYNNYKQKTEDLDILEKLLERTNKEHDEKKRIKEKRLET